MSEELDSFDLLIRKLKQIPLEEMMDRWLDSPIPGTHRNEEINIKKVRPDIYDFFNQHGWDYNDFIRQWDESSSHQDN